ncbi:MAG: flagellar basal-body rod protein FlgG [Candidatus Kapabacteria bacterium]|nr:flagellar basal-body rod protein FlgG [Candidatus Kapabacteria bacterium]MBX7156454.1 flagellar basal-body rod protein FlgG [Bacteroidota bacterium]
MDKTLSTAATGLSSQQRYIEIISNNLANVNTTGYKKVRPEFQDLLYETLRPYGNTPQSGSQPLNEVQIGSGTELVSTTKQFGQGTVEQTGNQYDMAINGNGFFPVRRPDNTIGYTRDGSFTIDKNGTLVTSQGYVLDPEIRIPDDVVSVTISRDGIVTAKSSGDMTVDTELGRIQLARFTNPAGLRAMGDNLYLPSSASGDAILETPGTNNTGEIIQNHLESSNVDLVQEMVNMILAQRAYEINSKSVKTADDVLNTAVNLKR